MLDYNLSTMEESVVEARQNRWIEKHIEQVEFYIRTKLATRYRLFEEAQEELTARAIAHAIEQVRAKAFIDKEDGGWGSGSIEILKRLKTRLKFFLVDEVQAYLKGTFGRGQSDLMDRDDLRGDNMVEIEEGEWVNVVENTSVGYFNMAPDSEQLLIWKQMFELIHTVADNTKDGELLLQIVTGQKTQKQVCDESGMATSTINDKVKKFRKALELGLTAKGYVKGEDF